MTTITCDICGDEIVGGPARIELSDGEHPHNESRMTKTADVCPDCVRHIPALRSVAEISDLRCRAKKGWKE